MKLAGLGICLWPGYLSLPPLTNEIKTVSETHDTNANFTSHRPNRENLMLFSHRKSSKSLIKSVFHIIYPTGTVLKLVVISTEIYVKIKTYLV
jgi:hypothetical protein